MPTDAFERGFLVRPDRIRSGMAKQHITDGPQMCLGLETSISHEGPGSIRQSRIQQDQVFATVVSAAGRDGIDARGAISRAAVSAATTSSAKSVCEKEPIWLDGRDWGRDGDLHLVWLGPVSGPLRLATSCELLPYHLRRLAELVFE